MRYVVWSCGLGFLLGVLLSALVVSSAISPFNVLSPGASLARCARSPRRLEMAPLRFDRLWKASRKREWLPSGSTMASRSAAKATRGSENGKTKERKNVPKWLPNSSQKAPPGGGPSVLPRREHRFHQNRAFHLHESTGLVQNGSPEALWARKRNLAFYIDESIDFTKIERFACTRAQVAKSM